jgi:hypothetical protein
LRSFVHHWRPIQARSDDDVAAQVIADKIDVLVDLAGHTGGRLGVFARQAAPIQVTWLGYPNTTGLEAMQYRLTDSIADPAGNGEVGLGHYEVRSWVGWHHHMTLSLLALRFVIREQERVGENKPALTVAQMRQVFARLLQPFCPKRYAVSASENRP